jgi:hypothetical protein
MSETGSAIVWPALWRRARTALLTWLKASEPVESGQVTLVFEATGNGMARVTCRNWEDAKVILADEALLVAGSGKTIQVVRTDPSGRAT